MIYIGSTLHTLTRYMSYTASGQEHVASHIVTDVCIHNPENINNCECVKQKDHCCRVLLLQQYLLALVNICNLEF